MSQKGFDAWLTTEPNPFPIHFNFDPLSSNYAWSLSRSVDTGECDSCNKKVGITIKQPPDGWEWQISLINYYQLDEDAETLWCEDCHDYEAKEI
jgi:hypothetical protein